MIAFRPISQLSLARQIWPLKRLLSLPPRYRLAPPISFRIIIHQNRTKPLQKAPTNLDLTLEKAMGWRGTVPPFISNPNPSPILELLCNDDLRETIIKILGLNGLTMFLSSPRSTPVLPLPLHISLTQDQASIATHISNQVNDKLNQMELTQARIDDAIKSVIPPHKKDPQATPYCLDIATQMYMKFLEKNATIPINLKQSCLELLTPQLIQNHWSIENILRLFDHPTPPYALKKTYHSCIKKLLDMNRVDDAIAFFKTIPFSEELLDQNLRDELLETILPDFITKDRPLPDIISLIGTSEPVTLVQGINMVVIQQLIAKKRANDARLFFNQINLTTIAKHLNLNRDVYQWVIKQTRRA